MTKKAKANILMGLLGCVNPNNYESDFPTVYQLLKNNKFDIQKIIDLHYALNFDKKTETSFISLAGCYATIKIKMSRIEDITYYVNKHDVEIEVG